MPYRVLLLIALVAMPLAAQTTMDSSSPKMAAKSFAWAIEAGDAAAAKKCVINAGDAHNQMIDAMAAMMGAYKKITDAASKKFGDEGKAIMSDYPMAEVKMSKQMDEATVAQEGDSATITEKSAEKDDPPMVLKKVDGQWKIDMAATMKAEKVKEAQQALPLINAIAKLMNATATEIADGKYRTLNQAKEVVQQRMREAVGAMKEAE